MTVALRVVRAGAATTVQDLGRSGHGRFGISPSGAMDALSHRLANHLVGNPAGAATLEVTGAGLELEVVSPVSLAVAGADLGATLSGEPLAAVDVAHARAGARLHFSRRRRGARAYLAVAGGIDVPLVLGSAATDLGAALGGLGGRTLRAGDELKLGTQGPSPALTRAAAAQLAGAVLPSWLGAAAPPGPFVLRMVADADPSLAEARSLLEGRSFKVSSRSGRTGFRFEGRPLPAPIERDRLSEPTAAGAIQLPPDGLPILLTADRNPTGGYPRLGHLARADHPTAAQLWPADEVRFEVISLEHASALARDQSQSFAHLLSRAREV